MYMGSLIYSKVLCLCELLHVKSKSSFSLYLYSVTDITGIYCTIEEKVIMPSLVITIDINSFK